VNASNGCCDCWYGYDADIGGGYGGSLLGKMLRIGMMSYTDIQYVHNVCGSGHVKDDSNIYEFIRNASESYGFGIHISCPWEKGEMVRIFETHVLSVSFRGKIISLFLVFLNQYINKSMTLHNIYEKAWIVIASVILLLANDRNSGLHFRRGLAEGNVEKFTTGIRNIKSVKSLTAMVAFEKPLELKLDIVLTSKMTVCITD